jgi:diguanylate cyclase (GGDEF)-like protein
MPEMDGLEVCRRLKMSPGAVNIPIIFLTADCSMNDKVKALDMGAVDYITKPFKPEELRARVRSALRTKHRLEQTEMVDGQSGLWNQTYFEMHLPVHLSLAQRSKLPLSCIVAELDHADKLRSKHGPDFEEDVIKSIATIFMAETRTEDIVCHSGKGRFLALIPATHRGGAAQLANRIRCEIERQLFYFDKGSVNVTCSFGVSDTSLQGPLSVVDAAGTALIRSKDASGNTVSVTRSTIDSREYPA